MTNDLADARFAYLFASPVLEHRWPDGPALNGPLRDSILAHARQDAGLQQTNQGGWHSEVGVLPFCGAAGERLVQHMIAMTQEATRRLYEHFDRPAPPLDWTLSAWANVNWRGHSNTVHTHPGATWSGVYYVDDGGAGGDGTPIQLFDPNPARTNVFFADLSSADVQVQPVPGLMILFPSYVPHAVPAHRGDRPRITIAFNVRKDPFP